MSNVETRVRKVDGSNGMSYLDIGLFEGNECLLKLRVTSGRFLSVSHSVMVSPKMADKIREILPKLTSVIPDVKDDWFVNMSGGGFSGPWGLKRSYNSAARDRQKDTKEVIGL